MGFDQGKTDIRGCHIGMRGIAYEYVSDRIKIAESAAGSRFNIMAFPYFIPLLSG